MTVSDFFRFKIGTHVYDVRDPRHIGRIDKIDGCAKVDVTWLDTGWKTLGIDAVALRDARTDKAAVAGWENLKPRKDQW